jgi:hypothetical protein
MAQQTSLHVTRSQFTRRREEALQPFIIACDARSDLTSLVPEEEYIHRTPHSAAEAFGLHGLYHA